MKFVDSPIDHFEYFGRQIYVKRDDLLHPEFSGNKARKLAYFLMEEFAEITTLVSYGGTQSNLMYSLSALAKLRGWQFIYYCYKPSQIALDQIVGNLAGAIANGMQLSIVEHNLDQRIADLQLAKDTLLVKQGAAEETARFGIMQLAAEIRSWARQFSYARLAVFLPSGTGATALYLQYYLPEFIVYTTNCVGDTDYLKQQWDRLDANLTKPQILANTKYRFATPHRELWDKYQEISAISYIEFDLVYDPVGWQILSQHLQDISEPILYIHCGGQMGNPTMKQRYKYQFKV